MTKAKTKKSYFKFLTIGSLLVFLLVIIYLQNKFSNLNLQIKSEFTDFAKNQDAEVLENNDLSIWWVSTDNLNIINDKSLGISLNLYNCRTDDSKEIFYQAAQELGLKIDKLVKNKGFTINPQNSSENIRDDKFYDYIQAYENNGQKCVFVSDPDCSSLTEKGEVHYTFSFSCLNQFDKNYQDQAKYLKDLGIKDAIIHVEKKVGDFVKLNVNYRRSGHYTVAQLINNRWTELFSGQDLPSCENLQKYQIPSELMSDCWPSD